MNDFVSLEFRKRQLPPIEFNSSPIEFKCFSVLGKLSVYGGLDGFSLLSLPNEPMIK